MDHRTLALPIGFLAPSKLISIAAALDQQSDWPQLIRSKLQVRTLHQAEPVHLRIRLFPSIQTEASVVLRLAASRDSGHSCWLVYFVEDSPVTTKSKRTAK
jgi:hypothetical protein